ncbi:protein STRUBBELIG-RECEPTOR FAMILY 8-like protein [Carex littledalei]|uniref:non-specific serine/threonine protein kinase n=1 Tax=Carex littledalei TaxID=544730 RepID=A0A833UZY7_9POAL|nr:protein STRUBBELIG-RECEPTOR FAMILY 8-like protein [Carex littledalei]
MSSQLSSFLSLTQLDMSYNNISGEIPSGLPPNATFINLAANKIVGNIPMSLPSLKNLKYLIEGNKFEPYFLNRSRTVYPPLPSANKNVSHTPKVTYEVLHKHPRKKKNVAVALVAAALSSIFVIFAISLAVYLLIRRARIEEEITTIMSSPSIMSQPIDLSIATNDYSREALIGAGPIGSVFKALFPDGQVLAVKRIEVVQMELLEGEQEFLDLVSTMSDLKHPNICILQGFCLDPGHHALLYDYARNGSLYSALFSKNGDSQKPLSWKLRLRIALGVAHALEYMHEICSPPIAHGNIKARNVLFDEEFVPHVTDFGLTMLSHILPATSVDFKMFEGSKGYTAPEMSIPGSDMIKCDIFSFGVLLLELLTGLKAFDSEIGEEEQYLVQYASPHLHDLESLQKIADPTISDTIPSHSLSGLADVILLCIQPVPEFRLPMSEVADRLVKLVQKICHQHCNRPGPGCHTEPPMVDMDHGPSFWTTNSHFDPSSSPSTARAPAVRLGSHSCKSNLTYEEALVSEHRTYEKVQQFPKELVGPVLHMIQYSTLNLSDLVDKIWIKMQEDTFEGSEMHARKEHSTLSHNMLKDGGNLPKSKRRKNMVENGTLTDEEMVPVKYPSKTCY